MKTNLRISSKAKWIQIISHDYVNSSLAHIIDASMEDLARCPGIGERKVKRLYDTFHEPFKRATLSYPSVIEPVIPETEIQKDVNSEEPVEADEDFVEDSRKRKKKEPEKV